MIQKFIPLSLFLTASSFAMETQTTSVSPTDDVTTKLEKAASHLSKILDNKQDVNTIMFEDKLIEKMKKINFFDHEIIAESLLKKIIEKSISSNKPLYNHFFLLALNSGSVKNIESLLNAHREITMLDLSSFDPYSLERVHLTSLGKNTLFDILRSNRTLMTLTIEKNIFAPTDMLEFTNALKENTTLTTIHFGRETTPPHITKILHPFLNFLNLNETITTLGLRGAFSDSKSISVLPHIFMTNQAITTLDLSYGSIYHVGVDCIIQIINRSQTLTAMKLSNKFIDDKGAIAIAEALSHENTLKILKCDGNKIGFMGAIAIRDMLLINNVLENLDISYNQIEHAGIKEIANALKNNVTLKKLNLAGNYMTSRREVLEIKNEEIGKESALSIKEMLCENTALTTLNLAGNSIGPVGIRAIMNGLEMNKTLLNLNLNGNLHYVKPGENIVVKKTELKTEEKEDTFIEKIENAANELKKKFEAEEYDKAVKSVISMLQVNNTLRILGLQMWNKEPPERLKKFERRVPRDILKASKSRHHLDFDGLLK